jgi:hypothetical protein
MGNSIFVIAPYKFEGTWVFDDLRVGLIREAFVSGADLILDRLTEHIPGAENGFRLLFSASPFPGYGVKVDWVREEYEGNWYRAADFGMEGWLCPALYLYFETAPKEIYIKDEPK